MIYSFLKNRRVYNLTQWLLAPNSKKNIERFLSKHLCFDGEKQYRVLELGCGTGFFSVNKKEGVKYIGTDIDGNYFPHKTLPENMSYKVMNAVDLKFPDNYFDFIYSCGLFHHLSDEQVRISLQESVRVLNQNGKIIVFDSIWPTNSFNVYARLIRGMDRGKFVRKKDELIALIKDTRMNIISSEKFYYTFTGLEGIIIEIKK